jgi:hypothetical protein
VWTQSIDPLPEAWSFTCWANIQHCLPAAGLPHDKSDHCSLLHLFWEP